MKDILPQLDLNKENTNLRSADGLRPSEARPQVRSLGDAVSSVGKLWTRDKEHSKIFHRH